MLSWLILIDLEKWCGNLVIQWVMWCWSNQGSKPSSCHIITLQHSYLLNQPSYQPEILWVYSPHQMLPIYATHPSFHGPMLVLEAHEHFAINPFFLHHFFMDQGSKHIFWKLSRSSIYWCQMCEIWPRTQGSGRWSTFWHQTLISPPILHGSGIQTHLLGALRGFYNISVSDLLSEHDLTSCILETAEMAPQNNIQAADLEVFTQYSMKMMNDHFLGQHWVGLLLLFFKEKTR